MALRPTPQALATLSVAAAWPWLVSALSSAMLSPIERVARAAWCGAPFHGDFAVLGHCPSCWAGSAVLGLTGILLMLPGNASAGTIRRRHERLSWRLEQSRADH